MLDIPCYYEVYIMIIYSHQLESQANSHVECDKFHVNQTGWGDVLEY